MSWTNAAVTAAGHALQAALVGTGKGLVFTRAASGAGLAAGTLEEQTAVTDERQALSLQPAQVLEGAKVRVRAVLVNTGLSAGYTMRQLGFYARAEDSGDEVLYALVQDEAGDPIPAAAESPGFSVDWTYVFSFGGAAEVTVELDPAGVIGWGAVGQPDGVAGLGPDGKVPEEQMPEMDYVPAGSAAPIEGLPTNDVRTGTVRDGQSIAAGDVVNVQDGEIYHDVVAQKNVENRLNTVVMTGSDLFKLNESYSILIGNSSSNPVAYLIDNTTGKSVYSVSAYLSAVLSVSGARLDDTHFVVQALTQTTLFAKIGTVNGTSISFGEQTNIISAVTGSAPVVALEADRIMSIFTSSSKLGIGISLVNGTTITQKQTYYLPGNVNAGHISATRIPDDDSGNKRVCICFSDTGDGNKGKAVIATVDSANAVTFGEVVTFNEASTTDIHCTYSLDGWVYVLFIDSATQMIAFNPELLTEKTEKKQIAGSIPNLVEICAVGHSVVGIYSSYAQTIYRTGNVLNIGAQYNWNNSYQGLFPSASITENNRFIIAYADGGNSSYGTTTILEISGNRIAGSFLNNSKDAIALESGEGGDTIKLGFGGYCACEGITAGQTIDSEGITAYSPLDGWLEIKDPWARGYVTGEYTGDGTYGADNPTVIDVGFRPECLIIGAESANSATGAVFVLLNGVNLSYSLPNGGAVNVSVNESQILFYANSASGQMNASGSVYRYIAWR